MLVKWAVVLTVGFLAVVIGGGFGDPLPMPGALTDKHQHISNCADCHQIVAPSVLSWMSRAFSSKSHVTSSGKCQTCHQMAQNAFTPHNVPVDDLARRSQEQTAKAIGNPSFLWEIPGKIRKVVFRQPDFSDEGIACATCHSGHMGETSSLTAMTNERCQTCHAASFDSFSSGHPEISTYPDPTATRINFDHKAHFNRHFPERRNALANPDCATCHSAGPDAQTMLTRPFEETCKACHGEQVTGENLVSGDMGFAFVSLPALDLETLSKMKVGLGEWPEDTDGRITPFTKIILAGLAAGRGHERIEKLDVSDLSAASDADLEAVAAWVWSLKEMLLQVLDAGPKAVLADKGLTAGLSRSQWRDFVQGAFPNIRSELERHERGEFVGLAMRKVDVPATPRNASETIRAERSAEKTEILSAAEILEIEMSVAKLWGGRDTNVAATAERDPASSSSATPADLATKWLPQGGWFQRGHTLSYRPGRHRDAFSRSWLEAVLASPSALNQSSVSARTTGQLTTLFRDKNQPGKCLKCHRMVKSIGTNKAFSWRAEKTDAGFTRFAHAPHLAAAGEQENSDVCLSCHRWTKDARNVVKAPGKTADHFDASFDPMTKSLCTDCHNQQGVAENCAFCHDYHVAVFNRSDLP